MAAPAQIEVVTQKKVLLNASEIIARTSDMAAVGVTEIPKNRLAKALQKI